MAGLQTPEKLLEEVRRLEAMQAQKLLEKARALDVKNPRSPEGTDLIQGFEDGGVVYKDAEGGIHYKGPSYATSNEADVLKIMETGDAAAVSRSSFDRQTIAEHPVAARAATAIRGVPFAGEWADEAVGLTFGPEAETAMRGVSGAMERERPGESLALQVGTGVAASIPVALAASGAAPVQKGGGMLWKMGKGLAAGATAGAVEGAVAGAGRADEGERIEGAISGAKWGALFGSFFGAGTPPTLAGFRNIATFVMKNPARSAARKLGISRDAVEGLKWAIENDGGADAVYERLAKKFPIGEDAIEGGLGPQGTIAAASGPAAQSQLDLAATSFGPGMRRVKEATAGQIEEAYKTVINSFDAVLGKAGTKEILKRSADDVAKGQKLNAMYDAAFTGPNSVVDVTSRDGRRVVSALGRVTPKRLRQAIEFAEEQMQLDGVDFVPLQITEAGKIKGTLTIRHLDEMKRAMQSIAYDGNHYDPMTGAFKDGGGFFARAATVIRDATRDYSPRYKTALSTAAVGKSRETAEDFGYNFASRGWSRENASKRISGMDPSEVAHAKLGLRRWIDDKLGEVGNVVSTAESPDDIKRLNLIFREMTKPNVVEKMQYLIGNADTHAVMNNVRRAGIVANLRAQVAMGSKTAMRQGGKAANEALLEPGVLGTAMQGEPVDATKRMVQIMTGRTKEFSEIRTQGFLADVAEVLVGREGKDAEIALRVLKDVEIGQPLARRKAEIVAEALSVALGAGGYTAVDTLKTMSDETLDAQINRYQQQ